MASHKVMLILAVSISVIMGDGLLKQCKSNDIPCLTVSTQAFLEQSSGGIPAHDILAIDPLVIPELHHEESGLGLAFDFKNITVTGLKRMQVLDFTMDKAKKTVVLKTRVDDAHVVADVSIEVKPIGTPSESGTTSKSLHGTYFAKTTVVSTANYNYELLKNQDGVEYFEVGPEILNCEAVGAPDVSLDEKLARTVATDLDTQARATEYAKQAVEIRRAIIKKFFEKAYVAVIHNLRAVSRLYPKTAFFEDV